MFDASVDAAARKFGIDSLKKQQVSAIKVTLCGNSVLFWQVSYLPATSLQVNDRKSICLLGIREFVLYIWEYVTCAPHV